MFIKPNRVVDRVFVHCSASDRASHDTVATIRRWHVTDNGWSDVGYHYFIRKSGQIELGRPVSKIPAAQGGHNSGTIAICLHGKDILKFTEAQFDALRGLALEINAAYDGRLTFHGHREVANKACPVFDYVSVLRLDAFGRLGLTGAQRVDLMDTTSRDPTVMPMIRRGARGPTVALAQQLMLIKDDGVFGPKTDLAVKRFQQAHGLEADGVVGQDTWAALFATDRIEHSGDA